jgi:hypothetical protein
VAKINANKTDFHDHTLDAKELAERAKIENEDAQRQAELDDLENEARLQQASGRVKKSKKHKSDNRGNFSSFRNKSFVPNASKSTKGGATGGDSNKESASGSKKNPYYDEDEDDEQLGEEGEEGEDGEEEGEEEEN